jgi:nucleoid-associated protein YgaU
MEVQTNCPICNFRQAKIQSNICPRCKTDLSFWNEVIDLPTRFYNQALQMIRINLINEAKDKLIASLALDPNHIDSQFLLGKIYAELGRYDEAIDLWEKISNYDLERSTEISELINKAKKLKDEAFVAKSEEQKNSFEEIKKEKFRKVRIRWILYSAILAIATLMIGIFIPYPSTKVSSDEQVVAISKDAEYKQIAENVLKAQGITDIQVIQDGSIISLSGKVMVPQEKYQLENIIHRIKGISTVDISGIEILYPNGYFYTVRKGDNLWGIAKRIWDDGANFDMISKANQKTISNPEKISPGTKILIPYREKY